MQMPSEVKLQPGWLARDVRRAAQRADSLAESRQRRAGDDRARPGARRDDADKEESSKE
jgi:hypothetical protein